jgi:hypothetical protein
MKLETKEGTFTLKNPTPELIKKLTSPFRWPPRQKPNYPPPTVEEAEARGMVIPERVRLRAKNKAFVVMFNARYHAKGGLSNGCQYKGVYPPIFDLGEPTATEEERNKLLKDYRYKLTAMTRYDRIDAAVIICKELIQEVKDDLLQEESGDIVNREYVKRFNELYIYPGRLMYDGVEEPWFECSLTGEEAKNILVWNKIKLTGLSDKKRRQIAKNICLDRKRVVEDELATHMLYPTTGESIRYEVNH